MSRTTRLPTARSFHFACVAIVTSLVRGNRHYDARPIFCKGHARINVNANLHQAHLLKSGDAQKVWVNAKTGNRVVRISSRDFE